MNRPYLSIGRLERRLSAGRTEDLQFDTGVNLLVGPPNSGKTKWLQTLDFLLGDLGANPFEGAEEEGLADKYEAAGAELVIGGESFHIERRWQEIGVRSKVFVDDRVMSARDFQQLLMQKLGIPSLNFPKGNPMSGQTWPELSFRMLLRHIYRQQRFWSDIADKQPEGEQHACLLQFLGLAEHLFTEEYGRLVKLKTEAERLKARRHQYRQTLDELSRDVLSEPGLRVGATVASVQNAQERLTREIEHLRQNRVGLIVGARDKAIPLEQRGHVEQMGQERANLLVTLEDLERRSKATTERLEDMNRYRTEVRDELDRMTRAEDAGELLADLKITHCPSCDQPIAGISTDPEHCFLCHRKLPDEPLIEELGAVRLQFERKRLSGELEEADELIAVLQREVKRLLNDLAITEERLRMIENELAPARQVVGGLIQQEVSAIDMALGELNERQRQLGRVSAALELGRELTARIAAIEREIEPLEARVNEAARATDFGAAVVQLEDGMNAYLEAINRLRPQVWRHNPVRIVVSRHSSSIQIGARRWQAALGGTDTLYFLMAYHYGLLTLSNRPETHYPGLLVIDVPGEFAGEAVEDKENFIVQPFVSLLSDEGYEGAQVIITGASFAGLNNVHRIDLTEVYVA